MEKQLSRKEFLGLGTKAALSLFAITACGELFSLKALAKVGTDEIAPGPDHFFFSFNDLKQKLAVNFNSNGKKAILLYNNGEVRAFENICTHKGGPNSWVNNQLVCQWHGAIFDPLTGKAIKRPAPGGSALPAIPVEIKDGKVYLAVKA